VNFVCYTRAAEETDRLVATTWSIGYTLSAPLATQLDDYNASDDCLDADDSRSFQSTCRRLVSELNRQYDDDHYESTTV